MDEDRFYRAVTFVKNKYGNNITYIEWLCRVAYHLKAPVEYVQEYIYSKEDGCA